jgi:hypothetical protein
MNKKFAFIVVQKKPGKKGFLILNSGINVMPVVISL